MITRKEIASQRIFLAESLKKFSINKTGTKICGEVDGKVYTYPLSVPWDLMSFHWDKKTWNEQNQPGYVDNEEYKPIKKGD